MEQKHQPLLAEDSSLGDEFEPIDHSKLDYEQESTQALDRSWRLLRSNDIFHSVSLYGIMAFAAIVTAEIFPLMALTDKAHGGFGFQPTHIGTIMLFSAPLQIAAQSFLFPILTKRLGYRRLVRDGLLVLIVTQCIFPLLYLGMPEPAIATEALCPIGRTCTTSSPSEAEIATDQLAVHIPMRLWTIIILTFSGGPLPGLNPLLWPEAYRLCSSSHLL
eukprot:m.503638 g.503638  ORF g.503638 m.503638 type:complete len:218 (+) comp57347_c0_seq28:98-751(+)